mmetsp:Transcript_389/g.614  ORF Transcript_389/g.614 Transcript_389/m.614 type:complete len:212 (-) Transcript_389:1514-2149(-)
MASRTSLGSLPSDTVSALIWPSSPPPPPLPLVVAFPFPTITAAPALAAEARDCSACAIASFSSSFPAFASTCFDSEEMCDCSPFSAASTDDTIPRTSTTSFAKAATSRRVFRCGVAVRGGVDMRGRETLLSPSSPFTSSFSTVSITCDGVESVDTSTPRSASPCCLPNSIRAFSADTILSVRAFTSRTTLSKRALASLPSAIPALLWVSCA